MFTIEIKQDGETLESLSCDRYFVLAEGKGEFSKSFSHNNFVDQLGMVEFAKAQILNEQRRK